MASSSSFFLFSLIALSLSLSSEAWTFPPPAKGLSYTFYNTKCPNLQSIVRNYLRQEFQKDIGLAAGLLRIQFHDCFVQGCDASVLLTGPGSEQLAPPDLTLRQSAFKVINDLQALIERACGRVVSCADIVTLAARDSVALSGGPDYQVPLGRRDSLAPAPRDVVDASLPAPTSNVTTLLAVLSKLNLDAIDLVTLSGGHTIGRAHCTSFTNRLYPTQDNDMDGAFAKNLKLTCPARDTDKTTVNDIRTPNAFDNKYYVDLVNREGLFTSDQDLYSDPRTEPIVTSFALSQGLFFERFVMSIIKMGQLSVLTGNQGEIRANCSDRNGASTEGLWPVVEEFEEDVAAF